MNKKKSWMSVQCTEVAEMKKKRQDVPIETFFVRRSNMKKKS